MKRPRPHRYSIRWINICLFMASVPVLIFLAQSYRPKEKVLAPFLGCFDNLYCKDYMERVTSNMVDDINESDAILSVDLLNNWHWCPSALIRMRGLDKDANEFLAKARRRGALVIHAVSDSKPHYLNEPGIIKASRTKAAMRVPDGGGRDWGSITKFTLRSYDPPPPTSLSLDRTCGDAGRPLFGAQKPRGMLGLNASNIDTSYDIVAIDQDVIYSAIKLHSAKIKRILYVGVHLDLCILYSRWFSLLRIAKFWDLGDDIQYGIVENLLDMSNSRPEEHYETQLVRDGEAVENLSCWISCVAAPNFLGQTNRVRVYDFRNL